ncbi:GntR family transcriptional regulator [Gracilibacillus salinarum]|uniref:GntR family transcriptional regulator n=1 Tax=Gracilibacillus salinarum TaxID=2932255 RepID=A0ABY4GKQ0_9BACI|nr:GntR family transcriptional regulator [Gracilibacillus salinarum]UOQ84867.1 GntR family transcriptional regulator [Gracilibacillus salinarum]
MNSKVPYYLQLKDWLYEQIEAEIYKKGQKLPSESELANEHGISRPTVRQALGELVQEGHLVKKRGLGTFVSSPIVKNDAQIFTTFAEEMNQTGHTHSAQLIEKRVVTATKKMASDLQIPEESDVYKFVRLRLADGEPVVVRTSYIPCQLYPDLLEEDLEKDLLYDILAKRNIHPIKSSQRFQAVGALPEEAKLLNLKEGDPLLLWNGIVFGEGGQPIEQMRAVYLGYQFSIEQSRNNCNGNGVHEEWTALSTLHF